MLLQACCAELVDSPSPVRVRSCPAAQHIQVDAEARRAARRYAAAGSPRDDDVGEVRGRT